MCLLAQQLQAQAQRLEAQAQQLTAQAQQLQAQAAQAQAEALEVQAVQVEAQLSAGLPRLQSQRPGAPSLGLLTQAKRELDDGEAEYADGAAGWRMGSREPADGERELADARQGLDEGWQHGTARRNWRTPGRPWSGSRRMLPRQLADALTELQNGERGPADLADYEEGKQEAEQELADAPASSRSRPGGTGMPWRTAPGISWDGAPTPATPWTRTRMGSLP